ncbi:MAG: UbiA family prenyltransferase, partial [Anaerolineae bacterium]|nr:UbiA family prenyltransferase [Anaerolineae bacterium]
MVKKLLAFLRLGRVGMSPLTMSVPVLGAFSAGETSPHLWLLMLIGLSAHFFGFGLNDLIDHPIDRKTPYRQRHPLTTGRLQYGEAWAFVLLQIPLSLALYSRFNAQTGLIVL